MHDNVPLKTCVQFPQRAHGYRIDLQIYPQVYMQMSLQIYPQMCSQIYMQINLWLYSVPVCLRFCQICSTISTAS